MQKIGQILGWIFGEILGDLIVDGTMDENINSGDDYERGLSEEKDILAEFAVRRLTPRTGQIFIATGKTAERVGELLVQSEKLLKDAEIYTHSLHFVRKCMTVHAERKIYGRVFLVAGCRLNEGQVDFDTGLTKHRMELPKGLSFDYFIWGTRAIDVEGIWARRDAEHLDAIVNVSKNIVLLPTSEKFGAKTGHQIRFSKNLDRQTDNERTWHIVVPRICSPDAKVLSERARQIDKVVERYRNIKNVRVYDDLRKVGT